MEDYQKDLELFRVNRYRSKRLLPYFKKFSVDDDTILIDPHVKDVLFAQGLSAEDAPRSVYKVDKLYEALSHYAPRKIPNPTPGNDLSAGIALAYRCFACKPEAEKLHILPMTPATVVAVTSKPSASAGLTNFGSTKSQSQTRALERGIQTLQGVKKPEPCLAFKRTQFDDKTRLVWGYPYSMTLIEGLLAKPLLDQFKGGCTPMAFAMTTGALGTKLRVAAYHREWAYSLDYSQFDASISSQLIDIAFKILGTWFDMDDVEPVTGKTVREILDITKKYFIYTPIVMPDGNIYYGKDHGVPSGSYFTQLVDSIVNVIVAGAISSRFKLHVSRREIFVLGDDLMMWSNRRVDLNQIANYVSKSFGMKLHGSEKSELFHYNDVVHYLGRDWDNGLPDLPESEIIKRMQYPESFRKYPKDKEEKRYKLHLMLLSYAAVYKSAWRIATRAIDSREMNTGQGGANFDVTVYCYESPNSELDPNFMSGLTRFMLRMRLFENEGDIPHTALQYWL